MASRIVVEVPTDQDTIAQELFDFTALNIPGWEPRDGQLDVWIMLATARIAARYGLLVTVVFDSIFRFFGGLVAIDPDNATQATADATFTRINTVDELAHDRTIPAGARVALTDSTGDLQAFTVDTDILIAAGSTSTSAGAVPITAVTAGAAASGLTGTMTILDQFDWLASATVPGITTGGQDAEDDDTYLDRLSDELQLNAKTIVTAEDTAILARNFPGIDRAAPLDGYNPDDDTFNNDGYCAVAVHGTAGAVISSDTRTALQAELNARRLVGLVCPIVDPTYTQIKVSTSFTVMPGFSGTDVESSVEAALTNYFDPGNWGLFPTGDATDTWSLDNAVTIGELYAVINNVEGVHIVTALTFAKQADALGTVDVALTGRAPLTQAGTMIATAV